MNNGSFAFVASLFIFGMLTFSLSVDYTYLVGRDNGEFSQVISAQPLLRDFPSKYFICSVAFLESRWVAPCGIQLWTQTNSMRIKFCRIDNWKIQIEKNFSTGNPQSGKWRQVNCPENHYAYNIGGRLGWQHGTDTGFVGTQIYCSTADLAHTVFVQDDYLHSLSEISKNRQGTLVSGLSIKYVLGKNLVGVRWYFEDILVVSNITIEYGKIIPDGSPQTKTIQILQKSNQDFRALQYNITFTQKYSVQQAYMNDNHELKDYPTSGNISVRAPALSENRTEDDSFYTTVSDPFQFGKFITVTEVPKKSTLYFISSCQRLIAKSVVDRQKATASYTAIYTFTNPVTKLVMMKKKTFGTWQGYVYYPIVTYITNETIPLCGDS